MKPGYKQTEVGVIPEDYKKGLTGGWKQIIARAKERAERKGK